MIKFLLLTGLLAGLSNYAFANNYEANLRYYGMEAVKSRLKDPKSAEFSNVRISDNVLCGTVNSKNSYGAYAGRERFITTGQQNGTFLESDMTSNDFAYVWSQKC